MYRIVRFLLAISGFTGAILALAQAPTSVPVTGNLTQIIGTPQPYAGVVFNLQNCPSPISITGYNVIVQTTTQTQANASGIINTALWPNDKINCGGTTGASQYQITYVVGGTIVGTPQCYQIPSATATYNLNVQQPITCSVSPPAPGDATFANLVVTNLLTAPNAIINDITGHADQDLPLGGGVMTGALSVPVLNNTVNAALLPGLDIGDAITNQAALMTGQGTIEIPDGSYDFSHTITINQAQFQQLTLHCHSRSGVLNYTGTNDAVYITSNMNSAAQVNIENCTIQEDATGGAGANGIHLYDAQNVRLNNVFVYNFRGDNLYAVGSIDGMFTGSDFSTAGHYNVHLAPDQPNQFASNTNRFIGGSFQYAGLANLWDQGDFSAYGGDTQNTFDGVTMEMASNHPQFIIEGTKNDAITNGYIEYINFPTSTGDLYGGIIGNYAGSGYGSSTDLPSVAFNFSNNYMIIPSAGAGHTVAALLMANTDWANIQNIFEDGNPTYAFSFHSGSPNNFDSIGPVSMGYATALYQNAPAPHNRLWWPVDAAPALGQYNVDVTGVFHFGGLTSSNDVTAIGAFRNNHGIVIPSTILGVRGAGTYMQTNDGTGTNGNCAKYGSGGVLTDAGAPCGAGGGGGSWATDPGGTNTTGNFHVGAGANFDSSGGTIAATSVPFSGVLAGTANVAWHIGSSGSLDTTGLGTITATGLTGTPAIAVASCDGCQHGSGGSVTYTTSTTASLADDGKMVKMNCAVAPCIYTLPATQPSATWGIKGIISLGAAPGSMALGGADTYNGTTTAPTIPAVVQSNTNLSTGYLGYQVGAGGGTGNVSDVDFTVPAFTSPSIPANTCWGSSGSTTPATVSMPGLATSMKVSAGDTGNPSAIGGWGSSGGLNIRMWASGTGTASYIICNPTNAAIASGSITFRAGAL